MVDGTCEKCKGIFTVRKMPGHLRKCTLGEYGKKYKRFLLKVTGQRGHWMYVVVDGSATLRDLDSLLRYTWLECCGHLSSFDIHGMHYEELDPEWDPPYEAKTIKTRISSVIAEGTAFSYEYDFGDTTELKLVVKEEYLDDKPMEHKANVLARNNMQEYACMECGTRGVKVCMQCILDSENPFLCERCSLEHEDEDEGHYILPVVNSPRMGQCAYGAW